MHQSPKPNTVLEGKGGARGRRTRRGKGKGEEEGGGRGEGGREGRKTTREQDS